LSEKVCHLGPQSPYSPIEAGGFIMHRVEKPIRRGAELLKLSVALYRELAFSALQLLPIRRIKALV